MRIYQAGDGQWILLLDDNTKLYYGTQLEALQTMDKLELAKAIIYQAQLHAKPLDEGGDVLQEYFDSGVTFTDEDVASLGVTATQVVNCLTLLEQYKRWVNGIDTEDSPQIVSVYRTTVNTVRRVGTT